MDDRVFKTLPLTKSTKFFYKIRVFVLQCEQREIEREDGREAPCKPSILNFKINLFHYPWLKNKN